MSLRTSSDFKKIRGWFEKSLQVQRYGTTGAYRGYFQLVASLGRTHQVSEGSIYFFVLDIRLNRGSRVTFHMSTTDAERSGCPVEITTPEIIDKIHDMVMDDRRVKVREIANSVGI